MKENKHGTTLNKTFQSVSILLIHPCIYHVNFFFKSVVIESGIEIQSISFHNACY